MATQCAVCPHRILAGEKRYNYYETDDGNHRIGNFVTKVKRIDGSLEKCCEACYKEAQRYVCVSIRQILADIGISFLSFLLCPQSLFFVSFLLVSAG
jgi:prenyltransferase beta subunit